MDYIVRVMQNYRAAKVATRQILNKTRDAVLAEAHEIANRAGDSAILVTRLAEKHGVAFATCKKWLQAEGFELNTSLRGRPSFEAVLVHDGLMDALNAIRAAQPKTQAE